MSFDFISLASCFSAFAAFSTSTTYSAFPRFSPKKHNNTAQHTARFKYGKSGKGLIGGRMKHFVWNFTLGLGVGMFCVLECVALWFVM